MSRNKIRNYGLVVESTPEQLVGSVTKAIEDGYMPIGGISMVRESGNVSKGIPAATRYGQAMIRLAKEDDSGVFIPGR